MEKETLFLKVSERERKRERETSMAIHSPPHSIVERATSNNTTNVIFLWLHIHSSYAMPEHVAKRLSSNISTIIVPCHTFLLGLRMAQNRWMWKEGEREREREKERERGREGRRGRRTHTQSIISYSVHVHLQTLRLPTII